MTTPNELDLDIDIGSPAFATMLLTMWQNFELSPTVNPAMIAYCQNEFCSSNISCNDGRGLECWAVIWRRAAARLDRCALSAVRAAGIGPIAYAADATKQRDLDLIRKALSR